MNEADFEAFEPSPSLWAEILACAPKPEHETIARAVGQTMVDKSLGLHAEVVALLEIWQAYKADTDSMAQGARPPPTAAVPRAAPAPAHPRKQHNRRGPRRCLSLRCCGTTCGRRSGAQWQGVRVRAAPTPSRRRFFVGQLGRAAREGDGERARVLGYALGGDGGDGGGAAVPPPRPGTATGLRGEVPTRPSTASSGGSGGRCASRDSVRSSASTGDTGSSRADVLNDTRQHINAEEVHGVVGRIREALEEECASLLADVEFLQQCLDGEHEYRMGLLKVPRPPDAPQSPRRR